MHLVADLLYFFFVFLGLGGGGGGGVVVIGFVVILGFLAILGILVILGFLGYLGCLEKLEYLEILGCLDRPRMPRKPRTLSPCVPFSTRKPAPQETLRAVKRKAKRGCRHRLSSP